jgi:diacylglycerol kinase
VTDVSRRECEPPVGDEGPLPQRFRCAFQGWVEVWHWERNVRIHLGFVVGITALGIWLQLGLTQWAVLALTYGLVLVAELLNSALEALTDLASPAYNPLARRAKDMAAGAVLVAALVAVAVGLLVLGPPLWRRLFG